MTLTLAFAAGAAACAIANSDFLYLALLTGMLSLFVALPAYAHGRWANLMIRLSHTDPLTGIGNRHALHTRLLQEVARCRRGSLPLSVLMIDVDRMKQINDRDGHAAGDEALRLVALSLLKATRTSDTVGRFGGDEFLVIAPETDENSAQSLADRIVGEVVQTPPRHAKNRSIDISIGVATLGQGDADVNSLMHSADQAMYAAKHDHVRQSLAAWSQTEVHVGAQRREIRLSAAGGAQKEA